jgi:hypothetical protein
MDVLRPRPTFKFSPSVRVSYAETVATNAGLTLILPALLLVALPFDAGAHQATRERRCGAATMSPDTPSMVCAALPRRRA